MEEYVEGERLTPAEAAEFTEFKRTRRETEVLLALKKMIVDASRRESAGEMLKKGCELAKRMHAGGILVSSANVGIARRLLKEQGAHVICLVGGTGECMPAVKQYEAKRAVRMGASEIRLVPCYSALVGRDLHYLRREVKRVRRAARGCPVVLSLEDRTLEEEEIALGVRAAAEGGAAGVCVRGETPVLLQAVESGAGKLFTDCSGVENAEQFRTLLHLGAARLTTPCPDRIADDLFSALG